MHLKSDDKEIMIDNKAYEVIEELFQSLDSLSKIWLETSIKRQQFSL